MSDINALRAAEEAARETAWDAMEACCSPPDTSFELEALAINALDAYRDAIIARKDAEHTVFVTPGEACSACGRDRAHLIHSGYNERGAWGAKSPCDNSCGLAFEHTHHALVLYEWPTPEIGALRKCLLCALDKPWGTFSTRTGETVCKDCQTRARRDAEVAALVVAAISFDVFIQLVDSGMTMFPLDPEHPDSEAHVYERVREGLHVAVAPFTKGAGQ